MKLWIDSTGLLVYYRVKADGKLPARNRTFFGVTWCRPFPCWWWPFRIWWPGPGKL